jgi:small basic protein (TIGR04137 family)
MSIDSSLRKKSTHARARNVLKRSERIATLKEREKWVEGQEPYNLPKVRVYRLIAKKVKKKKDEAAPAAGATAAAPAADAKKKGGK